MQAVEKPKCQTISPWALQRDQKLSLGSQSDQQAKYNAKEVGQNHTDHTSTDQNSTCEGTESLLLGFQTHAQDMHQSLFCISSPGTNLGSGQNSEKKNSLS